MARNHRVQWFDMPFITGTVTKVYPVTTSGRYRKQLYVDVLPIDNSFLASRIPWMAPAGVTRNARNGMQAGIYCVKGSPQFATAWGHVFNQSSVPAYADPLPSWFEYPDDLVVHHEETQSFIRFRNYGSSATAAGPDLGSPVIFTIGFYSGAFIEFSEYPPPDYPPAPVVPPAPYVPPNPPERGKLDINMPSGARVTLDEPAVGECLLSIAMPSGASVNIDQNGNITVTAVENLNLLAPHVYIGSEDGAQELAFKSDVQALTDAFNEHIHIGVQSGIDTSGIPASPAPDPIGTTATQAT
jgi:hypothetical protein